MKDDWDFFWLIIAGCFFGPALLLKLTSGIPGLIARIGEGLVNAKVFAPASADPILPLINGAGLDLARIIPLVALVLIVAFWGRWIAASRAEKKMKKVEE